MLTMCRHHPEVEEKARNRLTEITRSLGSARSSRADEAIAKQLDDLKARGVTLNPKTKHYRIIAAQLAKRHHIPFDCKRYRKKVAVMRWLSEHWGIVESECLLLLEPTVLQFAAQGPTAVIAESPE
jgi:hypothetical protein